MKRSASEPGLISGCRGVARIFQRGGGGEGHTGSNNIVMAFSPRNIVGCLLKKKAYPSPIILNTVCGAFSLGMVPREEKNESLRRYVAQSHRSCSESFSTLLAN